MKKYLFAMLFAVLPSPAFAQLVSLELLSLQGGIRNLGMGGTGVAGVTRMPNSNYNPAALAWADGLALTYETQPFDIFVFEIDATDARITLGDAADKTGWVFGGELGYRRLSVEADEFTSGVNQTDDYFSGSFAVGFRAESFAGGAGLSMKRATVEVDDDNDESVETMDLGVIVAFPLRAGESLLRPRAGVSVSALDNGIDVDDTTYGIRNVTRAGAGLDFVTPRHDWAGRQVSTATASLDIDHASSEDADDARWATGVEVGVLEFVYLRAGYQWLDDDDLSVVRFGAGLQWEAGRWFARADYAREERDDDSDFSRNMYGVILGVHL